MQIYPTTQTWDSWFWGWFWGRCLKGCGTWSQRLLSFCKWRENMWISLNCKIKNGWLIFKKYFFAFTVDIMALHEWTEFQTTREGPFWTSDVQPDQNLQGKITPPDTPSRSQQSHPPSDTTSLFPIRWPVGEVYIAAACFEQWVLIVLRISKCCKMTCCWFPLLSPSMWRTLPLTCNLNLLNFSLMQWLFRIVL